MKKFDNYYNDFKPELTPKKMLSYGVFGGSYFCEIQFMNIPKIMVYKRKAQQNF